MFNSNLRSGWTSRGINLVLLLSALFYALMLAWGGFGNFTTMVLRLNPRVLLTTLGLVTVGYLLRFLRWQYYLREIDHPVAWIPSLRIFTASFAMAISPGKVGETLKSYLLKVEFGIPASPTLAAFFCERFTDVLAMVLLSAAGFLVYPHGGWWMAAVAGLQVVVLFAVQKNSWVENGIFTPLERWGGLGRWVDRARRFYRSAGRLLNGSNLAIGTVLGILAWGLEGYGLVLILQGIEAPYLAPWTTIFVFSAAVLLGSISMLPGGLGSSEALMVGMLIFFGVGHAQAVSATLLIRLLTLWYGVGVGFLAWAWSMGK